MTAIAQVSTPHVHHPKPAGGGGKPPQAKAAPRGVETKTDNLNSGKSVNRTV